MMKTERFELKLSKADKVLFKKTAKIAGKSLGKFMVDAAMIEASRVSGEK